MFAIGDHLRFGHLADIPARQAGAIYKNYFTHGWMLTSSLSILFRIWQAKHEKIGQRNGRCLLCVALKNQKISGLGPSSKAIPVQYLLDGLKLVGIQHVKSSLLNMH